MDGWMGGWMVDRWMDGRWMDGWGMNGWMTIHMDG